MPKPKKVEVETQADKKNTKKLSESDKKDADEEGGNTISKKQKLNTTEAKKTASLPEPGILNKKLKAKQPEPDESEEDIVHPNPSKTVAAKPKVGKPANKKTANESETSDTSLEDLDKEIKSNITKHSQGKTNTRSNAKKPEKMQVEEDSDETPKAKKGAITTDKQGQAQQTKPVQAQQAKSTQVQQTKPQAKKGKPGSDDSSDENEHKEETKGPKGKNVQPPSKTQPAEKASVKPAGKIDPSKAKKADSEEEESIEDEEETKEQAKGKGAQTTNKSQQKLKQAVALGKHQQAAGKTQQTAQKAKSDSDDTEESDEQETKPKGKTETLAGKNQLTGKATQPSTGKTQQPPGKAQAGKGKLSDSEGEESESSKEYLKVSAKGKPVAAGKTQPPGKTPTVSVKTQQNAAKAQPAKGKKEDDDDEDDKSEEEETNSKIKTTQKTQISVKPGQKVPLREAAKNESESEEDSEEESDEENAKVKAASTKQTRPAQHQGKQPQSKQPPAQKGKKTSDSDEDEKEDGSENEAPKGKGQNKGKALQSQQAKHPAKVSKKEEDEEDEEDEENEEEKAPASKTRQQHNAKGEQTNGSEVFEVFVRGLSYSATEHDIREFFADVGEIVGVNLLTDRNTGASKGIAFVKFTTAEDQEAATKLNGSDHFGRKLSIEKAVARDQRPQTNGGGAGAGGYGKGSGEMSQRDPNSTTVFVGNLSYDITQEAVMKFFQSCGKINDVRLGAHPDGTLKGFAHVDFASSDSVDAAIAKIGEKLNGRPVKVDYSGNKPRGDRDSSGQRGESRGGGRGWSRGGGRGGGRGGRGGYDEDRERNKGTLTESQGTKTKL